MSFRDSDDDDSSSGDGQDYQANGSEDDSYESSVSNVGEENDRTGDTDAVLNFLIRSMGLALPTEDLSAQNPATANGVIAPTGNDMLNAILRRLVGNREVVRDNIPEAPVVRPGPGNLDHNEAIEFDPDFDPNEESESVDNPREPETANDLVATLVQRVGPRVLAQAEIARQTVFDELGVDPEEFGSDLDEDVEIITHEIPHSWLAHVDFDDGNSRGRESRAKFDPRHELDAPLSYDSLSKPSPKWENDDWYEPIDDALGLIYRQRSERQKTLMDDSERDIFIADWYFEKNYCLFREKITRSATIIRQADGSLGHAPMFRTRNKVPLLIVHLARSLGYPIHHLQASDWYASVGPPLDVPHDPPYVYDVLCRTRDSCAEYKKEDDTSHLFRESDFKNPTSGDLKFMSKADLKLLGFEELTDQSDANMNIFTTTFDGKTAYICECSRDTYILCPDECRGQAVTFFCFQYNERPPKWYFGEAKRILGLDMKTTFGDAYFGAHSLTHLSTLRFPLRESFRFGEHKTPMAYALYREIMADDDRSGDIPAIWNEDADEFTEEQMDSMTSTLELLKFLAENSRPDLSFFHDALIWSFRDRARDFLGPSADRRRAKLSALKECLLFVHHTQESALRFSAPPTPPEKWTVECYFHYEYQSQLLNGTIGYSMFLNGEPLKWRTVSITSMLLLEYYTEIMIQVGRRNNNNPEPPLEDLTFFIKHEIFRDDIFKTLSQIRGSPIPITFKTSLGQKWLDHMKEYTKTRLRSHEASFKLVSEDENKALFLAKATFGDEFSKRAAQYGLV